MGEAKRLKAQRTAELRAAMRVELGRLAASASAEEANLLDTIEALDFYKVERAPDDVLAYCRMKPQQCHVNAGEYARLDPRQQTRHISGWWKRGDIFYFHSVILTETRLFCVTPHPDKRPLTFAPDYDIVWRERDDRHVADRLGVDPPYLVRRDPEQVIANAKTALAELDAGVDPYSIKVDF